MNHPIPISDSIWLTLDSSATSNPYLRARSPLTQPSLEELFSRLKQGDIPHRESLAEKNWRLLLYPVLALIHHIRQVTCLSISCFAPDPRTQARQTMKEAHDLLRKWYELATEQGTNTDPEPTRLNLTLYHLLWLNTVVDYQQVEAYASSRTADSNSCISSLSETRHHGVVAFQLLHGMPQEMRPQWWPLAVYRVTLLLWMESHIHHTSPFGNRENLSAPLLFFPGISPENSRPMVLGSLGLVEPVLEHQLPHPSGFLEASLRRGVPEVPTEPSEIIELGIMMIEEGFMTPLAEEVVGKLRKAAEI